MIPSLQYYPSEILYQAIYSISDHGTVFVSSESSSSSLIISLSGIGLFFLYVGSRFALWSKIVLYKIYGTFLKN
jgi:hypothetical protein